MSTVKADYLVNAAGTGAPSFPNGLSAASAALTGVPTAPTASVATNTTQIATTAFVLANGGLGGVNIQSFTTSGTYTPTAGYKYAFAILTGGGQGGGGSGTGGYGLGGASAGTVIGSFALSGLAAQTVTVGARGAAGSASFSTYNPPGGAGGTSSIGSILSAPGGGSGLGFTGTVQIPGSSFSSTIGAGSFWGDQNGTYSTPGVIFGSGGNGVQAASSSGSLGGPGVVVIWEFK